MMPDPRPLIIGITGNIGSGKTAFCRYLEDSGTRVFYADTLAKEVLHSAPVTAALIERWGREVAPDGVPLPKVISERVFGKPEELAYLNSLVHPGTLQRMQELVDACTNASIIFEVPLLFEAGLQDGFDYLLLIMAPYEQIKQRLIERDGLNEEAIEKRLQSQIPDSEKAKDCDLVIYNNADLPALQHQAQAFIHQIPLINQRHTRSFTDFT